MKKYVVTTIALVAVLVPSAFAVNNVTINQLNRRLTAAERKVATMQRQVAALNTLGGCLTSTTPVPMVLRGNRQGPQGYAFAIGEDLYYASAYDAPAQGETPSVVPTINPQCLSGGATTYKFAAPKTAKAWTPKKLSP